MLECLRSQRVLVRQLGSFGMGSWEKWNCWIGRDAQLSWTLARAIGAFYTHGECRVDNSSRYIPLFTSCTLLPPALLFSLL